MHALTALLRTASGAAHPHTTAVTSMQTSAWGAVSMLHCTVTSRQQLYALRVLLGASQAAGTTSNWHLIAQFYPASARGLPMAVYVLGQVAAMMLAPPVSAGILAGMSGGLGGLKGWQWLYLVSVRASWQAGDWANNSRLMHLVRMCVLV
jgi:MFS family permease